jgi:hypothetical protein
MSQRSLQRWIFHAVLTTIGPYIDIQLTMMLTLLVIATCVVQSHSFPLLPRVSRPHHSITMNAQVPMSDEDIYGQTHPIESADLIASRLKELDLELDKLPADDTQGWTQAKTKCAPDIINNDFKLMFLRCEVFNADVRNMECDV